MWGTFDLDNYGDLLFPLVVEREMVARIPRARLRLFAPLGHRHPLGVSRVVPAEALGPWTKERCAELAEELDGVIVGGGDLVHERESDYATWYGIEPEEARALAPSRFFIDGLGPRGEARCPVLWNAVGIPYEPDGRLARRLREVTRRRPYVAVRDPMSRDRLIHAGATDVVVVPDPAFLLPRVLPPATLDRYLDVLRFHGWFPESGPALVVQGHSGLVEHSPAIAEAISEHLRARPGTNVVIVETGACHGDGAFADALQHRIPVAPYRLPPTVDVASIAAAIAGSSGFVGSSLHGAITAFVYERPFAVLAWSGFNKLEAFARMAGVPHLLTTAPQEISEVLRRAESTPPGERLAELQSRLDVHFDRIAEIIVGAMSEPTAPEKDGYAGAVRSAFSSMVTQAGHRESELAAAILDQRREIERQSRELDGQRHEIDELAGVRSSLEAQIDHLSEEQRVLRVQMEDLASELEDAKRAMAEARRVQREMQDSTSYRLGRRVVRTLSRIAPPASGRRRVLLAFARMLRFHPRPS